LANRSLSGSRRRVNKYIGSKRTHEKVRKTCKWCGHDNADVHRFHRCGSFCRTHYGTAV